MTCSLLQVGRETAEIVNNHFPSICIRKQLHKWNCPISYRSSIRVAVFRLV